MKLFLYILLIFTSACSVIKPDITEHAPLCQSTHYSAYQATVLGYCQAIKADLVDELPIIEKEIVIKPHHEIPEVFWFNKSMRYSLVAQKSNKHAPVIFMIAGTGASYQSAKMSTLQKIFYQRGYHVISLSSPTYANFIVNVKNSNRMPGDLANDARELYQVMQLIWQQVQQENQLRASSFALTGYSLGGAHSAYVSLLDESEKIFNFEKVLLLNPPVNLYNSVTILDGYFDLKENRVAAGAMIDDIISRFSQAYAKQPSSSLNEDAIYRLFDDTQLTEAELTLLIGASFRLSSSDMIFALDVMFNSGMVTYKNHTIDKFESLTHSLLRASDVTFGYYFENAMLKRAQQDDATVTREELISRYSLSAIETYLMETEKVQLVTNADDIILKAGEVDYLKQVFAKRAKIFQRGGHCGNYQTVEFVAYVDSLFANSLVEGDTDE